MQCSLTVVKDEGEDDLLSMDVTSEFCRSLAEISSYKFEKDPVSVNIETTTLTYANLP